MQYLALSKFIFTLKLPIFIEPRSFQNQNRTSQFFKNPQTGFSCGFADTFCYFSFIPTLWLKLYVCSILFFRHKIWYIFSLYSTHSISFSDFLQTKCRHRKFFILLLVIFLHRKYTRKIVFSFPTNSVFARQVKATHRKQHTKHTFSQIEKFTLIVYSQY